MEQLRAISCCSRPRSWRRRSTSLILRMDKPSWGMQFLLWPRGEIQAGYPAPLFAPNQKLRSRNVNIDPGAYASSCGQYSHPRNPYSHPRNVYSHPRNLYSLPAGSFINIDPESLYTSARLRTDTSL